ncbi:MAG: FAD-dependent oxidoreductase [Paracoccaceae bacterium]|nr:FAD-dependent oxidoreductase [Paracoccaceae bacterium]
MARDPRYDILFEPVKIGPVTARNRFYQAPHCNGMGRNYPTPMAVMRGVKAEGGWAVVFTEQCDFHYTTDSARNIRLWDKQDLAILARMTEQVHAHDSLAGIMLAHNGYITPNLISREAPLSPSGRASFGIYPSHAREMDKSDIKNLRRWHRLAALNAKSAGYDIVMIYAAHGLGLPLHFLSRQYNQRSDEYGGSLENRVRLLRELIEDTKEAIGDTCAVAVRLSVEELAGPGGITCAEEGHDIIEMLADLPDLWDVNVGRWPSDSQTSRFGSEGHQERYVDFVKKVTTRPVVGVGRFTSPDMMVRQIKAGILDLIGAARPSIADPFLPEKIRDGRPEDIRECIGCNICVTNNYLMAPIRCTQNPTMGEEWRRGWHPERVNSKSTDDKVLVIGAGAAGLEAARILGQRGYEVLLAEARTELGGRVTLESRLPGLAAWARVRDYRVQQLHKLPNVEIYLDSKLDVAEVHETGCSLVAVSTGMTWRKDGIGRRLTAAIPGHQSPGVFTPDDIMAGANPGGHVVIFDDDHYYMGSVVAEKLAARGARITFITPAALVAGFTQYTLEVDAIQKRLSEINADVIAFHDIAEIQTGGVLARSIYSGAVRDIACDAVVIVAGQQPNDGLLHRLRAHPMPGQRVVAIGDCLQPSTIASAVFSGHQFGRELGAGLYDSAPFRREDVALSSDLDLTDGARELLLNRLVGE